MSLLSGLIAYEINGLSRSIAFFKYDAVSAVSCELSSSRLFVRAE